MRITTQQDRSAEPETAGADAARPAGFVRWPYIGPESVFFYPPGSVTEHLVTEHGIPSVDMHRQARGYYDHQGDHLKQRGVQTGAAGDLLAEAHPHTGAREDDEHAGRGTQAHDGGGAGSVPVVSG